ncbi:anti-sigma factor family protein [Agrobacterium sp. NPDC058088]|uniref:anti-sigma factor family protein n=1 Tax=Agrobacterium sp. NPDC058088 TaxID=3346335 RepID=UPI0036DF29CC
MTGREPHVTEADLLSYVDGQLDAQRLGAVRAHLASNLADARKVTMWQQQNATLTALYGPVDTNIVPDRLDVYRIERRVRLERADWRNMAAAAVLILAVGMTGGWFGRGLMFEVTEPASIVADATQAHKLFASDVLHPVEVRADGGDPQNLPKWLSKRLDRKVNIPDLTRHGLSLVGGRVLPGSEGPAAQLMYEDKGGQRVTLYIVAAADSSDTAMRRSSVGSLETVSWDDEMIRCALVGNLPSDRMDAIAKDTYQQLS